MTQSNWVFDYSSESITIPESESPIFDLSKSDPTNETATFFIYNSIQTATHSLLELIKPPIWLEIGKKNSNI